MHVARTLVLVLPLAVGVALPAPAQAEPTRLHIHVKDADGTGLDLTVPFALTEIAPEEILADADIHVDHGDLDVHRLRAAWKALRQLPDGEQIVVEDKDARLVMTRIQDRVHFYVDEKDGERVLIDLPAAMLDALFAGSDDALRVGEALEALGEAPDGGWIEIRHGDEQVRIWTS